MDFLEIRKKRRKGGEDEQVTYDIYPEFVTVTDDGRTVEDVMIRGHDYYAIWDEKKGLWSTKWTDSIRLIDNELKKFAKKEKEDHPSNKYNLLLLRNGDSGQVDKWLKYVTRQMKDSFVQLDQTLIFANTETKREDYASRKLAYSLEEGDISAWDELVGTLYSEEERHKIEWAIGSIVNGDSRQIQKFLVFYGSAGSGKSTILNVIQELFKGYDTTFDAKALASANDQFAFEPFQNGPLVGIQHDGDLSRIEDNTRLNSLVSHEEVLVNVKNKPKYPAVMHTMLFMGTNKPVHITDAKSGITRRLIDVRPTEERIEFDRYLYLTEQVKFELGAIAKHCLDVYESDKHRYDKYIPLDMMGATNDFYNYMEENFDDFCKKDYVLLTEAWTRYKRFCDDSNIPYPYKKRVFKEELKSYFREFTERAKIDGESCYSVYRELRLEKFDIEVKKSEEVKANDIWLKLDKTESLLDKLYADCPAQYGNEQETPQFKWENVTTKLKDLDTSKLHYILVPDVSHIFIDFDLRDENGNKSKERNLEEAAKWPKTYAEYSKGGEGIHLHYIYKGDATKLSRVFAPGIEVKVCTGNSSLRRRLSFCNDIPMATISSGLPLREEKPVVDFKVVESEASLAKKIKKALNKEYEPHATKTSIDLIFKMLTDAYESGLKYDLTSLRPSVLAFAAKSTNHADYCIKLVNKMPFKSDEPSEPVESPESALIFYDVEVFPNLFVVVWKAEGMPPVKWINPNADDIRMLAGHRLVGFNCRRYDNHILYARMMGYTEAQLYQLSQRVINGSPNCFFSEAYNLSYTDVYDFCAKKQSLKKWEIELDIHHQELGLPWDKPVPEELWKLVADYCVNDVIATEATFNANKGDFVAREILVKMANIFAPKSKSVVNDTTNTLTGRIIFGDEKNPQSQFVYTDLSTLFPGYKFEKGKSSYRDVEEVGEGGRVYAVPGMYSNVKTFDVKSMHPHSAIALNLFGDYYTQRFKMLVDLRIMIKDGRLEEAKKLFDGALAEFLNDPEMAGALAAALKIAINSVYGLTSAKFDNKFRDPRNVDNIVAKRGALFMIDLQHAVEDMGGTVVHIKTDSIKVENPTPELEQFILDYGRKWGYEFDVESEYDRMCLVNDAVYIAKYKAPKKDKKTGKEIWWTATGTQFAVPYVFKTLFSHEPIEFRDMCETKTVTSALYLDMNEGLPDVSKEEAELEKLKKKTGGSLDPEQEKRLTDIINSGHKLQFVGKAGSFCPIKPGCGGGLLLREKDGKYSSATGAKGFRWLEAETVRDQHKEGDIDISYYAELVDNAVATIQEYGDFEVFAN